MTNQHERNIKILGYNSKVSIEKEKIEVDAQLNFNQNNQ